MFYLYVLYSVTYVSEYVRKCVWMVFVYMFFER